jgi:phosphoribosyl-AMP cyclohydrolase
MVTPDFKKGNGLIPVIVQDDETKEVLMLAYMNCEAWLKTLETGKATYWSRSRNELWIKGETSGHIQLVKEILIDCDSDTVLLKVDQIGGAACHTGYRSCFYRKISDGNVEIIGERIFDPGDVYK